MANLNPPKKPFLSKKQSDFVHFYAQGYSQKQAAEMAGYPSPSAATTGSRLSRNKKVIKALEAERKKISGNNSIDAEWILAKKKAAFEEANQAQDRQAELRALELIGKQLGVYTTKTHNIIEVLENKSIEQIIDQILEDEDARDLILQRIERMNARKNAVDAKALVS